MNARLLWFCLPALFAFECGKDPGTDEETPIVLDTGTKDTGGLPVCPTFSDPAATFVLPPDQVDAPGIVNGALILIGTDPTIDWWLQTYQPPEVSNSCFIPMGFGEGSATFQVQCPSMTGILSLTEEGNGKAYMEAELELWETWTLQMQGQLDGQASAFHGQANAQLDDEIAAIFADVQQTWEFGNASMRGTAQLQYEGDTAQLQSDMVVQLEALGTPPPQAHTVVNAFDYLHHSLVLDSLSVTATLPDQEPFLVEFADLQLGQIYTGPVEVTLQADAISATGTATYAANMDYFLATWPQACEQCATWAQDCESFGTIDAYGQLQPSSAFKD